MYSLLIQFYITILPTFDILQLYMSTQKGKSKVNSSHTSVTETAARVVQTAGERIEVTKISLGIIKHVGGGERRIKFTQITGGIKATVRGSGSVQELFIYTTKPSVTQKAISDSFTP